METGDRISELYKGEIWTEELQSRAQQRIHWMCQQVEGQKVIDIGCSQGIISILLAREGFEVIGIDTDIKAIEYANADWAKEPPEVQQRLTFIRGNIYDADLPISEFHTAIMGEFLEHQVRPDKAIARAYELLVGDGRLIITVPFGLLRDPDHKQSFYTASLYKLLYSHFVINEVEIIDRWLCLLCKRRKAVLEKQMDSMDLSLVEREEQEFLSREIALTSNCDIRKRQVETFQAELNTTKVELNTAKRETNRMRAELARVQGRLQAVKASLSFELGHTLIQAISNPGGNTILLPYRVVKLGIRAIRRQRPPLMVRSTARKAHVLEVIRGRIKEIKQELGSTSMYATCQVRKDLKIAVIMDEFTYDCFKYEANLITFKPENWKEVLVSNSPDFLLIESAWLGNDSSWRYQIVDLEQKPRSQLPELVQWCKARNIPTAFWCKEDPTHYSNFLDAARLFDYVFTTDAECVERYKEDLRHDNILCLPFAVQPRIHNPVGSGQKARDVAFAGSWYEGQNEFRTQRKEQMACILEPALSHDVDIYDRHYTLNEERFRFPEQYQPYIVGELPYEEMVYAYKMYRIFLNVNSVTRSPTMFPRRVLEILASGTYVLSGYAEGIENIIGSDIVRMPSSPEETRRYLEELLGNNELRDKLTVLGLRKVMKEHTCEKRLDYVIESMGITGSNSGARKKGVSIITCTNKLEYMENIFANYDRQEYYEKELIIVLNNNLLDVAEWTEKAEKYDNVRVHSVDENTNLGACLNFGIEQAKLDYVAKFDDDDYYAPAYLEDMTNAFDYSGADIVGKCTFYVYFEKNNALAIRFPGREFRFTDLVAGSTIIVNRKVFDEVRFAPDKGPGEDTHFRHECLAKNFRIFSADRHNYVSIRRASKERHTWKIGDEEMMKGSQIVTFTSNYIPSIMC
ncbi:MAG: glycosyltransferase [Dehalococcoidia bacterium]